LQWRVMSTATSTPNQNMNVKPPHFATLES
jgi:hypothetical protein